MKNGGYRGGGGDAGEPVSWRHRAGGRPAEVSQSGNDTALDGHEHLQQLLTRCGHGDETAFAGLYDQVSGRVYGTVLSVLGDPAQSAEVAQEVFVDIWRHAARYDPIRGSVLGWIVTIAHRRAVDRVRAERRARERDVRYAEHNAQTAFDSVAETVEGNLEAERVRVALEQLTELQRDALRLTYLGGCTQAQAADRLGVPLGTMKTRLRDGLIRLRQAMEVTR